MTPDLKCPPVTHKNLNYYENRRAQSFDISNICNLYVCNEILNKCFNKKISIIFYFEMKLFFNFKSLTQPRRVDRQFLIYIA